MLQDIRVYNDIYPVYKMVDTCGGEFDAVTPYYYSCYDEEDESVRSKEEKILVIGSRFSLGSDRVSSSTTAAYRASGP